MKKMVFSQMFALFCAIFVSGCDLSEPQNKKEAEPPAAPVDEPKQEEIPAVPPPQGDNTVTVRPGYNFSGRGSSLASADGENPMGIITVPVKTLFTTQDRLVLQKIEYAMNLYKAEHGKSPATEAEFTERIIKANNLILPQLPAGQAYVYDPRDGELKIRKPSNAP